MQFFRYIPAYVAAAVLALVLGACGASSGALPAGDINRADPLRLVVLIVVDQYPSWSFERDVELFDGGIARLAREGVVYPRVDVSYAGTYTAPGHATLGTGAPPADTHILANSWYDTSSHGVISASDDPGSPVLLVGERASQAVEAPPGVSGARLAVEGVADVLRRESAGQARSVSISLKERGAVFAAGRRPDLAVWYDSSQAAMTTSTYYAEQPPAWLLELAQTHPIRPRLGGVWDALTDVDHARVTGIADRSPGEPEDSDVGCTFPLDFSRAENPGDALQASPLGDDVVLEAATMALTAESLGLDDVADLLAISLSAHDYVGHEWGQESWERLDLAMRLDDKLGQFLDRLDAHVGPGRYAVVLTSDHGATPLVERSLATGRSAGRLSGKEIIATVEQAVAGVLGEGQWVARMISPSVYMSDEFLAQTEPARSRALDAAVAALAALPGVGYAARTDEIAGSCEQREGVAALACRSVVPGISGQIYLSPAENHVFTRWPTGTGHGGYSPSDRFVPVLVYAPGWSARRIENRQISILQVAPTIAKLLGISAPPAARAPALQP